MAGAPPPLPDPGIDPEDLRRDLDALQRELGRIVQQHLDSEQDLLRRLSEEEERGQELDDRLRDETAARRDLEAQQNGARTELRDATERVGAVEDRFPRNALRDAIERHIHQKMGPPATLISILQLGLALPVELTIDASGAVARTQVWHSIDTENDDATDDLVTVTGGTLGDLLLLTPASTREVVLKFGATTHKLALGDLLDASLGTSTIRAVLFIRLSTAWVEIARNFPRSHNTWKVFHSDGSGETQEVALGAAGTVYAGQGVGAAPAFDTMSADASIAAGGAVTVAATHSGSAHHTQSHGVSDHSGDIGERVVEILIPLSKPLVASAQTDAIDGYQYKERDSNVTRRLSKLWVRFASNVGGDVTLKLQNNGGDIAGASITVSSGAQVPAALVTFTEETLADNDIITVVQTTARTDDIVGIVYVYGDEDVVAAAA